MAVISHTLTKHSCNPLGVPVVTMWLMSLISVNIEVETQESGASDDAQTGFLFFL